MVKKTLLILTVLIFVFTVSAQNDFDNSLKVLGNKYSKLEDISNEAYSIFDQQSEEYLTLYVEGHALKNNIEQDKKELTKIIEKDPVNTFDSLKNYFQAETRSSARNPKYFEDLIELNLELLSQTRSNYSEVQEFKQYIDKLKDYYKANEKHVSYTPTRNLVRDQEEYVVTASSLNLRSEPNTDCDVISVLSEGEVVVKLSQANENWFKVRAKNGEIGYLHKGYLKSYVEGETPKKKPYYIVMVGTNKNTPYMVQRDTFLKHGEILVTFDDGPTNKDGNTSLVLDTLEDNNLSAIFFALGSKIGSSTESLIKREAKLGEAGVHGYYHATPSGKSLQYYSVGEMTADINKTKDKIFRLTNVSSTFFRPPYGVIKRDQLKALENNLGLMPLGWTIDTMDWSIKDPSELTRKVKDMISSRGKGVLLMHDIHNQSRITFMNIAKWINENGYKVITPEEALKRLSDY